MSYHGHANDSLCNAITRAYRRARASERKRLWPLPKRKRKFSETALKRIAAQRLRHGIINAWERTDEQVELHRAIVLDKARLRQVPVTLAGSKVMELERSDRECAEIAARATIETAVVELQQALNALVRIPNPNHHYKNRVQQIALMDAIRKLARSVMPPIPIEADGVVQDPRVKMPLERVCVSCGGPGRVPKRGEWYCGYCAEAVE